METVDSANASLVSSSYSYSYEYSNNQGSSTSASASGNFTWSPSDFTYVNGTDNQVGFGGLPYSKPIRVWFAMNPSLAVGSTFFVLNTQFTVLSKNYSLLLPTENNRYVQTIEAQATGEYQRNDSYGVFTASYTWDEYFDPATGYIVGYNYVEQDDGSYQGQSGSFTYTDDLYVTTTSYTLLAAPVPTTTTSALTTSSSSSTVAPSTLFPLYLSILLAIVVILIIIGAAIAFYASRRRRRKGGGGGSLPQHPQPPPYVPRSPPPISPGIDLGSRRPEQVVIRDVAKVNCKYCGTLIPTTDDRCPYCGAPRQ